MKITLSFFTLLLALAATAGAYTGPTSAPTANNAFGPLSTGVRSDVKNAGLSVAAFEVRSDGWHKQETIVQGLVRGGRPGDVNSTIEFGGSSNSVSLDVVGGSAHASGVLQSDSLQGSAEGNICADREGTLVRC